MAEYITGKAYEEAHVAGLTVSLLSGIVLLALIVYYYYVKRLDLTEKIASQPLVGAINKVLLNGYYVEYMIHWFSKNIMVESVSKGIAWSDHKVVDASVNATVPLSKRIAKQFAKMQSSVVGNNSGAMVIGLLLLLVALIVGGLK